MNTYVCKVDHILAAPLNSFTFHFLLVTKMLTVNKHMFGLEGFN